MIESRALYDSFNARYLSFKEVADTFIINDHFNKLISNNHTLLMGPRGCGKTTLLKMLTLAGISQYDKKHDSKINSIIPFRSIYIPTDVQWKRQLDILEKKLNDNALVEMISKCTMLITVLESLCKSFSDVLKYECNIHSISESEITLSKKLIDNWNIKKPIVPTLQSIEIYFLGLISDLNAQINKRLLIGGNIEFNDLFYRNFFDLVKIGCETFYTAIDVPRKKWALCFDELEIAPQWLQSELLELLRSSKQDYIFKLTTAPIVSLYKQLKDEMPVTNASEGNDYNVIRVWTSDQKSLKEWKFFCENILKEKLENRVADNKIKSAKDIFGESFLEFSIKDAYPGLQLDYDKDDYEENTPTWFAFKELASKDMSFQLFLRTKGIDPVNPVPKNRTQVDEVFRKIKQLVIYRLHLKKDKDKLRSRKVVPLYFGIPAIFEICDGNPRILIGVINDFLNLAIRSDGTIRELSINEQTRILNTVSQRYLLVLATHPEATIELNEANYNIVDLIEHIANYFFQTGIVERFKMDQYGSFKVDSDLPNKLIKLLEFGLHHGAFVYLDNNKAIDREGVLNKKFRLTYTLAPFFNLIPRNNKDLDLTTILSSKSSVQSSLFKSL